MTDLQEAAQRIRFELDRYQPKAGDMLVLRYPADTDVTPEQRRTLSQMIAAKLPEGCNLMLVPEGWKLELYETWKLVKDRQVVYERPASPQPRREKARHAEK